MIPGNANPLLLASAAADAAAAAAGPIKSVRFNSADEAYLDRTPSSAGNRKTWTWSAWVKRCAFGVVHCLFFGGATDSTLTRVIFGNDTLELQNFDSGTFSVRLETNALHRDPSAWYHFVVAVDTTQATAADRVKMYVNGVEQDSFLASTYPTQNQQLHISNNVKHSIGLEDSSLLYYKFDGYMADVFFIDGQQLDCTSFGAFDDSGVWQSASYSGTFGTNGFHLFDFANESGIGDDSSGNDNDFTANNFVASSNNWANYVYAGGATYSSTETGKDFYTGSGDDLFDGTTNNYVGGENVAEGTLYFRPEIAITGVTSIQLYGAYNAETRVNGSVVTVSPAWTTSDQYVTIQSPPSSITEISVKGSSGAAARLKAIKVNGSMLTDSPGKDVDVLRDVPTNGDSSDDTGAGGQVSGNYATINPLHANVTNMSLTNGNLNVTRSQTSQGRIAGTIGISSGKYYFEATRTTTSGIGNNVAFGVTDIGSAFGTGQYGGNPTSSGGASQEWVLTDRSTAVNGSTYTNLNSTLGNVTEGDVVQVAVDMTAGKIWFGKNGTFSGTPASGSSAAFSNLSGTVVPLFYVYNGGWAFNAGQRSFAYSAPSGFKALCTTNLPTPTIARGKDYFNALLYTGNGTNPRAITGVGHSSDLVWIKGRNAAAGHAVMDSVRGTGNNTLASHSSGGEGNETYGQMSSFDSDGFTVTSGSTSAENVNHNNRNYVAWSWEAASSTASNTDGSITSSVRASQTSGMSIVTYTGNNTAGATVGHGLNAEIDFMMIKRRNATENWLTYNRAIGATKAVFLNLTDATHTNTAWFNDTDPSSSVFTLGSGNAVNNGNNDTYVAYCFSSVNQFSSFGSYTGNQSTDGTFVYTGFKPELVILKHTQTSGYDWAMNDAARNTFNPASNALFPSSANAEDSTRHVDLLSNGFKIRNSSPIYNQSGIVYVYMAWASHPFQANGGLAR